MCLESCKTTKYPVLTEVETRRSRTPCQQSLPGPPLPGPCRRGRRASSVSGVWGSSALWALGKEVPTIPTASQGWPGGCGLFIAFPSIFLPFDLGRGCCFEEQQISACSLSGHDSPPSASRTGAWGSPAAPVRVYAPRPVYLHTPDDSQNPPGPQASKDRTSMKRVSLACLFFLSRPGTWVCGLLGAGTSCSEAMGDFSHAPKPCPCLQTAKVPMLAGIWGSLPNLKPGEAQSWPLPSCLGSGFA